MYPTHSLNVSRGQCALLLIDPQNDFHDGGSLAVPGASAQAVRIAKLIRDNTTNNKLGEIFVTLDSHHKKHIAHKSFWSSIENDVNNKGKEPEDFELITEQSLEYGLWHPKDCTLQSYCLKYTHKLEKQGRFKLTIWPDHCLIGSDGHAVQDDIQQAIRAWDTHHFTKSVKYIHKGMNCLTEMYSAIVAEVPVPTDHTTTTNMELLNALTESGRLLVCGQALSHCVNFTVRDIVDHWKRCGRNLADIHILADGSAPVKGYEEDARTFISDMRQEGLTISSIDRAFEGWQVPAADIMTINFASTDSPRATVDGFSKIDGEGDIL